MIADAEPPLRRGVGGVRSRLLAASWLVPILLMAAWTVLSVAWIWSNPIGSAPDEPDHYTRAVATGYGQLTGSPAPLGRYEPKGIPNGERYFTLPLGMAPSTKEFACSAFHPDKPAICVEDTTLPPAGTQVASGAGPYMPTGYLVPGVVMRLASDPATALRLGRLASALLSLSLLGVAVAMLWSRARSAFALLGLLVAVTPQQIFLITEVGPNGLELAAATCFAASAIRMIRPEGVRAWHWAGLAYGGVLLAATRPLGPIWVAGGIGVVLVLRGEVLLRRLRERPLLASAAVVTIAAGAAANLWWQARNPNSAPVSITDVLNTFWDGVNQMPQMFDQMIGDFGWLDTTLPEPVYAAWMLAVVTLGVLALLVGSWRERVVVLLLAAGIPLVGGGLVAYLGPSLGFSNVGQGVQGRYLLPMALFFPLVCGEVVHLHRDRLRGVEPRRLVLYMSAVLGLLQADALYLNGRRYAVGADGPFLFLGQIKWRPPGGWGIWILLALMGAALFVLCGVASLRARNDRSPPQSAPSTDGFTLVGDA